MISIRNGLLLKMNQKNCSPVNNMGIKGFLIDWSGLPFGWKNGKSPEKPCHDSFQWDHFGISHKGELFRGLNHATMGLTGFVGETPKN